MSAWELPLSFHTEAFESSETEIENYCLLRAEILLSISDPGVRYLFHSSHFSLARAGSALHTCVFVTRRVQSDSVYLLTIETTIERNKKGGFGVLPLPLIVLCGGFP